MIRKKNKKYKKAILNLILYIILLSILIYSGIKIFKWYKDKTNNPKTGDNIAMYISVFVVAVVGITATMVVKKRNINK